MKVVDVNEKEKEKKIEENKEEAHEKEKEVSETVLYLNGSHDILSTCFPYLNYYYFDFFVLILPTSAFKISSGCSTILMEYPKDCTALTKDLTFPAP